MNEKNQSKSQTDKFGNQQGKQLIIQQKQVQIVSNIKSVNNVGIVGEKVQQPNDIISRIKNTSSAIG